MTAATRSTAFLVVPFCLIWSSAFAVGKVALADCPPLTFVALRFLIAGAVLAAWAAWRGAFAGVTGRALAVTAALAVFNQALYLGLSFAGLGGVSSGLTSLVVSANPILTAVAAAAVLGERLSARKGLGLVLGLAGVALVVRSRLGAGAEDAGALLLTFGALAALTTGTLLFKVMDARLPILANVALQSLFGGVMLLPAAWMVDGVVLPTPSPTFLATLAWMVLVSSIGGYLAWFALLARGSATAASAWHFTLPPLGLLFGWLLHGEPLAWSDLAGIVPVAAGIALVTRPAGSGISLPRRRRRRRPDRTPSAPAARPSPDGCAPGP